jgi:hypothetical protein
LNTEQQRLNRRLDRYLLVFFLLTLPLLNPWVRGDGVGYYAYARAPLIEHSLDFTRDYQNANDSFRDERLDAQGQPKLLFRTRTGHLDNHFTVGPALLWSPFLLLAHLGVLLARAFGSSVPADGFSAPYRYAMALGTGFYGFLGLLLSFRMARKYVQSTWAFLATLAIWWGSSLPVYMYFNPSWSHAHSAFTSALFLWYWDATRERRRLSQWLVLGLIAGLMLNVYYSNLMIISVLLVEAIAHYRQSLQTAWPDAVPASQLLARHLLFVATVCACLLPTFLSRQVVYGGPFESGYVSIRHFLWHSPAVFPILFSSDHGLLAWTPLLAFSFLGLVLLAWRLPKVGLPFLVACLVFYSFFSFYPDWDGISSYGNRFFVSLTPLFILGLAITLERFAALFRRPRVAVFVASAVLNCFVLWNMGMIYQWGTHLVPARGPISFRRAAYNQFAVVPREISSHLQSYFLRRSDLMRQIEQKDLEQQKQNAQP